MPDTVENADIDALNQAAALATSPYVVVLPPNAPTPTVAYRVAKVTPPLTLTDSGRMGNLTWGVDLTSGAGSGPFEYDYLIDPAWTGTDGTQYTTFHGHTFKVYTTIAGAVTDANANRQAVNQRSTFCLVSGDHTVSSQITYTPPNTGLYSFVGAMNGARILAGANSITLFSIPNSGGDQAVEFNNVFFDDNGHTSVVVVNNGTGVMLKLRNGYMKLASSTNVGVRFRSDYRGVNCDNFHIQGAGTHFQAATSTSSDTVFLNGFHSIGATIAVDLGLATVVDIRGTIDSATTGIRSSGAGSEGRWNFDCIWSGCTTGVLYTGGNNQTNGARIRGLMTGVSDGRIGVDFNALGVGALVFGIDISLFLQGSGTGIGIRGAATATRVAASHIHGCMFVGFTSGNEYTNWSGSTNTAEHNISVDSLGNVQALADIGSPVGHATTSVAAPNDAQYLTLALSAGLTAERRFVPGTGLTAVDGGANADYTLNGHLKDRLVDTADSLALLADTARVSVSRILSLSDGSTLTIDGSGEITPTRSVHVLAGGTVKGIAGGTSIDVLMILCSAATTFNHLDLGVPSGDRMNLVSGANLTIGAPRVIMFIKGSQWYEMTPASPVATKGGLYTYSTVAAALAVGTNRQILEAASAQATGLIWRNNDRSIGVTIINPAVNDTATLRYFPNACTLTEIRAVRVGGTSVTINVQKGADRSAAGSSVFTVDPTITSTTIGDTPAMDSAAIPAGWLWVKVTGVSGTPAELHVTATFTQD